MSMTTFMPVVHSICSSALSIVFGRALIDLEHTLACDFVGRGDGKIPLNKVIFLG